nr:EOG090X07AI [Scapholeberis mucronata]
MLAWTMLNWDGRHWGRRPRRRMCSRSMLHVSLLHSVWSTCMEFVIVNLLWTPPDGFDGNVTFCSLELYGWFALVLYLCQYLSLLALPQALFNFLGFMLFNPFPDDPKLQKSTFDVPFICFRVVTRGDYPELVRNNVQRNINTCLDVGLDNFVIQVVTDKSVSLITTKHAFELVVPEIYQTKSGAMFKARALQYCLEDGVNQFRDEDWIVHLDEETILTTNSVKGIINFVCCGKHQFGQGMITYANEEIVNYFLTLCDTLRVAEDMGKIQFQLRVLRMPILGWKGSYVVSQLIGPLKQQVMLIVNQMRSLKQQVMLIVNQMRSLKHQVMLTVNQMIGPLKRVMLTLSKMTREPEWKNYFCAKISIRIVNLYP